MRLSQPGIVTIAALKGGVGKTTLSTNVAVHAASLGKRTLLVDLDPEACATNNLAPLSTDLSHTTVIYDLLKTGKVEFSEAIIQSAYPGLHLLPSALRNHHCEKVAAHLNPKRLLRERLVPLSYDLILLELPLSFTTVTGAAYLASDLIILPCTPSIFALESVALTIEAVDKLAEEFEAPERNFKILMNQFNSKRVASTEIFAALKETYPNQVFPFVVRDSADIQNSTNIGKSVFDTRCSRDIRNALHDLTVAICSPMAREARPQ